MTADQKIAYIEKQMIAVLNERQNSVNCPYCGEHNIEGNELCCLLFARAAAAIMVRWDLKDRTAYVEKVIEKASRN